MVAKKQHHTFKKSPNSWWIHGHAIFRKRICGRHGHCLWPSWLWPSWSLFVAVMIVAVLVIVCGHHGLWPSWWLFVAIMVCGCHCRIPLCVCELGKLTTHKSRFQEEFPELAAGADDKAQKKEDENKELQYGPGPSLRPQSESLFTHYYLRTLNRNWLLRLRSGLTTWILIDIDNFFNNDVIMTSLLKKLSISIKNGVIKRCGVCLVSFKIIDRIRRQSSWASCELCSHRRRWRDKTVSSRQRRRCVLGITDSLCSLSTRGDCSLWLPCRVVHQCTLPTTECWLWLQQPCNVVFSRKSGCSQISSHLFAVHFGSYS